MTERWFIPTCLGVLALLLAGLWAYLSGADEGPRRSAVRITAAPSDAALDPFAAISGIAAPVPHQRVGPAVRAARNRGGSSATGSADGRSRSWRTLARDLTRRVDDAAVRLRSNFGRGTLGNTLQGMADMQAARHASALRRFEEALARSPSNAAALSAKASTLVALERFDEALLAYEALLAVLPDDVAARYNRGVVLYRLSRFSEASDQFREVVLLDPDHAEAHYNLATLAQRAGRLAEARTSWEAFTRLRPDVAPAWFNLGVIQMDYDRPLAAAACFDRAAALSPDDPDAHMNLGLAYADAGYPELALEAIQTADNLSPCDPAITRHLDDLRIRPESVAALAWP